MDIRMLAVDPGSKNFGWVHMTSNRIVLGPSVLTLTGDNARSYTTLFHFIRQQLEGQILNNGVHIKPNYIAIEQYFPRRQRGATIIPEVRGIIKLAAYQLDVNIVDVPPSRVKKFVTGNGKATKDEVRAVVCSMYSINLESSDAADAIAIGLTAYDRIVNG